jgi:DNA-binding MarR family transcriptional regulator
MEHDSKQRVGLVPARYIEHPGVGALELAVLVVLCAHANRQGVCWPSQATIAAKTKLDRGTVNGILAKLVGLELIEKSRHPNPKIRACIYRLVGHQALMADFLNGLDPAAGKPPVEMPIVVGPTEPAKGCVGIGHTEHVKHSEQESLSLERECAPEGKEVSEDAGPGHDSAAPLSETWVPSIADRTFAQVHRPDLTPDDVALVAQKFALHYRGQLITDPSTLFRRWLLTERKSYVCTDHHTDRRLASHADGTRRTRRRGGATSSCSGQARFDAWAHAALARREHFAHVR